MLRRWTLSVIVAGFVLAVAFQGGGDAAGEGRYLAGAGASCAEGCVGCHSGIEEMHPWFELSCTACHGGDPKAVTKEEAHVRPHRPLPADERVLPKDFDPAYLQFQHPTDLRVVNRTCQECHPQVVEDMFKSLHATTSGHLSDSLYENGFSKKREDRWAIFPVRDTDGHVGEHAYKSIPGFLRAWTAGKSDSLSGHAADLGRKNCMQCHLWSVGTAVRSRSRKHPL